MALLINNMHETIFEMVKQEKRRRILQSGKNYAIINIHEKISPV